MPVCITFIADLKAIQSFSDRLAPDYFRAGEIGHSERTRHKLRRDSRRDRWEDEIEESLI